MSLLDENRSKAAAGERNPRFAEDLRKQLDHRIIPHFKNYALNEISHRVLSEFVHAMRKDGCSSSTIQRALVSVRQVIKHAIKLGLLQALPAFPVVARKVNPRPWFSEASKSTVASPAYYDANGTLVGPALLYTDQPGASAVMLRVGDGLFPVKLTVSDYLTNGAVWSLRFATNLHKIDFDQPGCTGTMYVGGSVAPGIETVGGVARDSVTGKYTLYLGSASERVVHFASSYYDQGATPEETICVTPAEPIERGSAPVTSTFDLSVYALPLYVR